MWTSIRRLRHPLLVLGLVLLLQSAAPSAAQGAAASSATAPSVPYAAMVIIALILALMAAGLLVVASLLCHFTWIRRRHAAAVRSAGRRTQLLYLDPPSTLPKALFSVQQQPTPPTPLPPPAKSPPTLPPPTKSPVNEYLTVEIHEPAVEAVRSQRNLLQQPPRLPELPSPTSSSTDMRHTASQFTEFLSHKFDMERARQEKQEEKRKAGAAKPQSLTTTFQTQPTAAVAPARRLQENMPRQFTADSIFDSCESATEDNTDEAPAGTYDNLIPGRVPLRGEADRYEVAIEIRDTRHSDEMLRPDDAAGGAGSATADDTLKSGASLDWFEEVSAIL